MTVEAIVRALAAVACLGVCRRDDSVFCHAPLDGCFTRFRALNILTKELGKKRDRTGDLPSLRGPFGQISPDLLRQEYEPVGIGNDPA